MMRFPLSGLLDEQACHRHLLDILRPQGLCCPLGHRLRAAQAPHARARAPVVGYRCRACGAVYNLFTGGVWAGAPTTPAPRS